MNHTRFGPMISAYMDGELAAEERAELLVHVRDCRECAALLADYQRLRADMRGLERPAPPLSLADAVRQRVEPQPASQGLGLGGLGCALTGLISAATGALVGLVLEQGRRGRRQAR